MSFITVSYFPELVRVRNALELIKNDWEEIQADFAIIEDDINTIKTLGDNCNLGIHTTTGWSKYARALAMISVLEEDQLAALRSELSNPSSVPE